jgi:sodium-independent sulfate anion transporter 11
MLGISGINTHDAAYKVAINTLKKLGQTKIDAGMGVSALLILYVIRYACEYAQKRYPAKAKVYFFLASK